MNFANYTEEPAKQLETLSVTFGVERASKSVPEANFEKGKYYTIVVTGHFLKDCHTALLSQLFLSGCCRLFRGT